MKKYSVAAAALIMSLCAQPVRRTGIAPQAKAAVQPTKTPEVAARAVSECLDLQKHGKLPEARSCFAKLAGSHDPYLRAEAAWGLERYKDSNEQFKIAVAESPNNPEYRVRWGRLFLERYNKDDAAKLFAEALEVDPNYAPAYLGQARVAAEGFSAKAVEFAHKALELDPKLVEAQELLAYLALEDNDTPKAIEESEKAMKMSP
ncbi:MAG: tetratricopeptide repeat protein, partial [Acidobacteriaceae bacterium]|nr:tetratricopeptide repeat protein [Acidobacteriaceae bacterium]